jgi:hypothetical protein
VINKQSFKYLSSLIKRYETGLAENFQGANVLELNKYQVSCLKNLLSDWLGTLPVWDRDPTCWTRAVVASTVMDEKSDPASFWSILKQVQKPKKNVIEFEPSQVVAPIKYVGIDLGTNIGAVLKKLLASAQCTHLLIRFNKLVKTARVSLAFHKDFEHEDEMSAFACQFQVDEVIMVKITGFIYNDHQLVFIVDSCESMSKMVKINSYPVDRKLFIEYGYADYGKIPQTLVRHLRSFDRHLNEYVCDEGEQIVLFDEPLVCLGKVKFYLMDKIKEPRRRVEW